MGIRRRMDRARYRHGAGLYDAAFATLGGYYGRSARSAITTLTLWGGFASTVCWPLSALFLEHLGWRGACMAYAGIHLAICLPLVLLVLPSNGKPRPIGGKDQAPAIKLRDHERRAYLIMMAIVVLAGLGVTIISVHLLTLLQQRGLSLGEAVALGALIGPAQVAGRIGEMASGEASSLLDARGRLRPERGRGDDARGRFSHHRPVAHPLRGRQWHLLDRQGCAPARPVRTFPLCADHGAACPAQSRRPSCRPNRGCDPAFGRGHRSNSCGAGSSRHRQSRPRRAVMGPIKGEAGSNDKF